MQCWSSEESKKLTMLVRALNFNVGLQQYTVALVTELEEVASVCRILREEESHVQAAVFGFKATARGWFS